MREFRIESVGQLHREIIMGAYTHRELAKKIFDQNERIEELEEQLSTATMWHGCDAIINKLKQENQQLKQSQNSKAIEELRKVLYQIKNKLDTTKDKTFAQFDFMTFKPIIDYIDNQIKELGGRENESK